MVMAGLHMGSPLTPLTGHTEFVHGQLVHHQTCQTGEPFLVTAPVTLDPGEHDFQHGEPTFDTSLSQPLPNQPNHQEHRDLGDELDLTVDTVSLGDERNWVTWANGRMGGVWFWST